MLDAPPLDASASYQVSSALNEFSEFLITPSACDTKNRQKLLRNLRVRYQKSLTDYLMKSEGCVLALDSVSMPLQLQRNWAGRGERHLQQPN